MDCQSYFELTRFPYFMHYSFARIHSSLRVTPAMAAGITEKLGLGRHGCAVGQACTGKAQALQEERRLSQSDSNSLICMGFTGLLLMH